MWMTIFGFEHTLKLSPGCNVELLFLSFKAADLIIRLDRVESLITESLCESKEQLQKPTTERGQPA
jgi:hypothetical protein